MRKIDFKNWMIKSADYSEGSAINYSNAVFGVISEWAVSGNLTSSPVFLIRDVSKLMSIYDKIQDLEIFSERNSKGNNMYTNAFKRFIEFVEATNGFNIVSEVESELNDQSLNETERKTLIESRLGQGKFRNDLIEYWKKCSVTGYPQSELLIASHIKPWKYSNNQERLDKYNGLLLTPNLDKPFDLGFISFDKAGRIMISELLKGPDQLGIFPDLRTSLENEHLGYLAFHRKEIFLQ